MCGSFKTNQLAVSVVVSVILGTMLSLITCGGGGGGTSTTTPPPPTVFSNYHLTGAITPVHDPSVMRQGSTYYVFETDPGPAVGGSLPILCSTDRVARTSCGHVFAQIPP